MNTSRLVAELKVACRFCFRLAVLRSPTSPDLPCVQRTVGYHAMRCQGRPSAGDEVEESKSRISSLPTTQTMHVMCVYVCESVHRQYCT